MLKHISPTQIESAWPFVKQGLEWIIKRCPGTVWTTETVYWRLVRDQCWLFADDDGFFIVERCVETHTDAWYLNVWCIYFLPGKGRERVPEVIAQLDALKKQLFCKFVQGSSPRLGWGRAMKDYFKLHLCIWRRD